MKHYFLCLFLISATAIYAAGEVIDLPLKGNIAITGNFGELRNNHFHSGVDFRAPLNTPLYAVDSGYVSRISVSASGYGNALYVTHASGLTTVYGHLNRFAEPIEKLLRKRQYELEYYAVDITFSPEELPVKRGDIVAYSGNRGSSGGPHLHFEVRESVSENTIDPLNYYKDSITIKDKTSPKIQSVAVIPINGVVNGVNKKLSFKTAVGKNGIKTVAKTITGWGDLTFGVKGYDYMNGMTNIYGIRDVKLFVDDKLVFESNIDRCDFAKNRMLNSYVDYQTWIQNRSFIMRSYVAPGNTLPFYSNVVKRGVVTINQEREYNVRYELRDIYNNVEICTFTLLGKRCNIQDPVSATTKYSEPYSIDKRDFKFTMQPYSVYEDWTPYFKVLDTTVAYSKVYNISPQFTPIDKPCKISIKVLHDNIENKRQYYIARAHIDSFWDKLPLLSEYKDGWVTAETKTLGTFVVMRDSIPPKITPVTASTWGSTKEVRMYVNDNCTGVSSFRGEIDGKFVLFELDCKDKIARYRISDKEIKRGERHELVFTATDACGNKATYKASFLY